MRRALLLGAPTHGLVGIANDLRRMAAALDLHGFHCRTVEGDAATRAGILGAIRQFIDETRPDHAVLLYYSGHGGEIENRRRDGAPAIVGGLPVPPEPQSYRYLVPTDHARGEFRGILQAELAALLGELTVITRNVTVVLDCCHASGMLGAQDSPTTRYQKKSIPKPWAGPAADHLAWLRDQGYDLGAHASDAEGNPHVIRLVACAPDQHAFESFRGDGTDGGLLTEAFVAVLHELHGLAEAPTWDAILKSVRERVRSQRPGQHPDVLGPIGRRLFTRVDTDHTDIFAYAHDPDGHLLRAGSLHGIHAGDRFLVMPLNANTPARELALAELEADDVEDNLTRVKFAALSARAPAPGARAFRVTTALARHGVRLGPGADPLAAHIADSPRLAVVEHDAPAIATVERSAPGWDLRDGRGRLVRRVPQRTGSERAIVRMLEQLARVAVLSTMRSGTGSAHLAAPNITWDRLDPEGFTPLPNIGAGLRTHDRILVHVKNQSRREIHVSILVADVARAIRLLSTSAPHGILIPPQGDRTLGQDPAGRFLGIPLDWPDVVPLVSPQPLVLAVVATDMPVDLRSLEAEFYDAEEVFARHVARPVILSSGPPTVGARTCRVSVTHLSADVSPP